MTSLILLVLHTANTQNYIQPDSRDSMSREQLFNTPILAPTTQSHQPVMNYNDCYPAHYTSAAPSQPMYRNYASNTHYGPYNTQNVHPNSPTYHTYHPNFYYST